MSPRAGGVGSDDHHQVTPMGRGQRLTYRIIRGILELWCRTFWRMEVRGRDRLPASGPFVVSPVHRSYIDFAVIGAAVPRIMRFMGKDSVWKVERLGRFLDHLGAFPVDRERVDRVALRNSERALELGDPLVMFPEGRRKEGPVVEDLQEGPAWIACRHRVPIVPVGIGNSDRAMPIGAKWLRPVKLTVIIGEPIYPDVPLTGRVPRGKVAEMTEQLRVEVQRLYDEASA